VTRILLVDDDERFRTRLARSLTNRGHDVRTSDGMETALQEIGGEWKPDRAVVDLRMDGPSGLEVLDRLAEEIPKIQVVILTGYGSIATTVEAMRLGAHSYVAKPADTDEILAAFGDDLHAPDAAKPRSLARIEWEVINRTLVDCKGNVSETARRLGLHRRTLQRRLSKFPPNDEE